MAIKGKGKKKGHQPARAPRRMPVKPPVPIARRRWVQVTASALLGAALVMFVVWVTNGIRASDARKAADAAAAEDTRHLAEQRTAAGQWQSTVEGSLAGIAKLSQQGPPVIAGEASAILDALVQGDAPPDGAAETLDSLAQGLTDASKALGKGDVSKLIRGKGFDLATTEYLLRSQEDLSSGLAGAGDAIALASTALQVGGAQGKTLAEHAKGDFDRSKRLIADAWRAYQNALAAAGLIQPFTPPGQAGAPGLAP